MCAADGVGADARRTRDPGGAGVSVLARPSEESSAIEVVVCGRLCYGRVYLSPAIPTGPRGCLHVTNCTRELSRVIEIGATIILKHARLRFFNQPILFPRRSNRVDNIWQL